MSIQDKDKYYYMYKYIYKKYIEKASHSKPRRPVNDLFTHTHVKQKFPSCNREKSCPA